MTVTMCCAAMKESNSRHGWQIDIEHYLSILQRKPGATASSVTLKQAPAWVRLLNYCNIASNIISAMGSSVLVLHSLPGSFPTM